jgi:hypothetical protein
MAGLVPAIHALLQALAAKTWMPAFAGMTETVAIARAGEIMQ